MLLNSLYFRLKPLIPRSVRRGIRRRLVQRKRRHVQDVWPILPGSERPPEGWQGWPDGKQFAFVLTHDVESQRGLDHVKDLAKLEMEFGFRSSFNFVPEGLYSVPPALRSWLVDRGFEVGVHDLNHDGRLFSSQESFRLKAQRINHYLGKWGAVGFRSGYMLRNLDWIHDLDIAYDACAFDTDPFEPQPDGVNTIFPFWVPRQAGAAGQSSEIRDQRSGIGSLISQPSPDSALPAPCSQLRSGYVELPYTLPQDSTVFLMLRERTIEIWKTKLDWIAEHGGMALINVHPDYICFGDTAISTRNYPVDLFSELLRYVRKKHGDSVWHALPREIAEFTALQKPRRGHQPKRICMLAYSHYETDARVKRYAEALAERGDHVDVVALKRSPDDPIEKKLNGVNLHNLQARVGKGERSPLAFLFPVLRFLSVSTLWITRRHFQRPFDLLHIHNMPDFLVFAALYPKLTGARVILDIHDILPEFYGNKFRGWTRRPIVSLLELVERVCAKMADIVIVSNHLWLDKYAARTGANEKCSVFINNVDTRTFRPRPRSRDDGKLVILFPGGLQWHQGLDIALRAFRTVSLRLPNAEFHIYGDGIMKPALVNLARELQFNGNVHFFPPVRVTEIAEVMANADLGVVPKRADSFGNEAYSTKIMEFMAVHVPVVVSKTKIDQFYFNDSMVRFFESGNPAALADAICEVLLDQDLRRCLVVRASEYAESQSWERRKSDYLNLADSL